MLRSTAARTCLFLLIGLPLVLVCCRRERPDPFLLLEGKGWEGKLSLGDPEERIKPLGKPLKRQEEASWRYYDYGFAEVMVDLKGGTVTSILLRRGWKTGSGITEGDSVERIQEIYGKIPYRPPIVRYPRLGIAFVLAPRESQEPDESNRSGWVAIWARIFKPER